MSKTFTVCLSALLVLALTGRSSAQACVPPANEDCAGAQDITFDQLPLSIAGILGCTNDMVDRPYFDLFYRYDCTVTGMYRFDMCGSLGDTYMRIYTDGCGFSPASSWIEDDDSCGAGVDPLITTTLQAGTSYWIEVGSWRVDSFFPPNANDPFLFNMQYLDGAANPWADLGDALGGDFDPALTGSGPLTTGSPIVMELSLAPPSSAAHLVLGFTAITAPFKGGVLVPSASLILSSVTSSVGIVTLAATWPGGLPPGATFYAQYWIPNASGPVGFLASNAISGTTPP